MAREKKSKKFLWITMGVIMSIILLLVCLLIFTEISIKDLESSLEEKQASVEEAYEARELETKELVKHLKPKMDQHPELFTNLEKAEKNLKNAKGVKAMSDANIEVDKAINAIVDTLNVEYPNFLPDWWNSGIAADIDTARHRLVSACGVYNKDAKEYNSIIQEFPGNFVANIAGHEGAEEFQIVNYKDLAD